MKAKFLSGSSPSIPGSVRLSRSVNVTCRYVVGTNGSVSDVQIIDSSGNRALDQEVIRAVKTYRYSPAMQAGTPREVTLQRRSASSRRTTRTARHRGWLLLLRLLHDPYAKSQAARGPLPTERPSAVPSPRPSSGSDDFADVASSVRYMIRGSMPGAIPACGGAPSSNASSIARTAR